MTHRRRFTKARWRAVTWQMTAVVMAAAAVFSVTVGHLPTLLHEFLAGALGALATGLFAYFAFRPQIEIEGQIKSHRSYAKPTKTELRRLATLTHTGRHPYAPRRFNIRYRSASLFGLSNVNV